MNLFLFFSLRFLYSYKKMSGAEKTAVNKETKVNSHGYAYISRQLGQTDRWQGKRYDPETKQVRCCGTHPTRYAAAGAVAVAFGEPPPRRLADDMDGVDDAVKQITSILRDVAPDLRQLVMEKSLTAAAVAVVNQEEQTKLPIRLPKLQDTVRQYWRHHWEDGLDVVNMNWDMDLVLRDFLLWEGNVAFKDVQWEAFSKALKATETDLSFVKKTVKIDGKDFKRRTWQVVADMCPFDLVDQWKEKLAANKLQIEQQTAQIIEEEKANKPQTEQVVADAPIDVKDAKPPQTTVKTKSKKQARKKKTTDAVMTKNEYAEWKEDEDRRWKTCVD